MLHIPIQGMLPTFAFELLYVFFSDRKVMADILLRTDEVIVFLFTVMSMTILKNRRLRLVHLLMQLIQLLWASLLFILYRPFL